jgi:hypothetical protein
MDERGKEVAPKAEVFEFEGGDVQVWIEQEAIHLRACDQHLRCDPAELTAGSARKLASQLLKMADEIND